MNSWATSILWGMLQVTLLTTFGLLMYAWARRRGPAAGALASIGTLLAVLVVTGLALAPLPNAWNTTSLYRSLSELASPAPPVATNDAVGAAAPRDQDAANPPRVAAASPGMTYFWEAFVDEMRRAPVEQSGAPRHWPLAVLTLFAFGATLGLFRLIAGATAVGSYRRHSRPIADAALYRLTQSLRAETGCRKDVELRESSRLSTPATVGCFRPLVLLPDGWREWSRDELRAVLAHELAHVARGDYLSGLLAQVTLAVHFYHPLVHWLVGRLRLEQELAADASGMQASGGRDSYLVTLAGMALRQDDLAVSWAARPFLPTRGTFMRRIEMLRDSRKQLSASLPRGGRALLIGALSLAGLVVAGLRPGELQLAKAQQPQPTGFNFVPIDQVASKELPLIAVSPDVKVHMAARPAAIFSKPELAPLAKQLSEVFAKDGVVIELVDVASVSFVFQDSPEPTARVALRGLKGADWKKLVDGMPYSKSAKEVTFGRHKYTVLENSPQRMTILPLDDLTIVIQPESSLKSYLAWADSIQSQGGNAPTKWAALWAKVNTGHAAMAIDPSFLRPQLERMTFEQLGPMMGFAPLWKDSEAAVLGIGLDNGMKIEGFAEASTADGATRIARTLDAAKAMFLNLEPTLRQQVANEPGAQAGMIMQAIDAGAKVINSATVASNDKVVELKAEGPADIAVTIGILAPAVASARESARRAQSMNNLKQIGLAMHLYADTYKHFPGAVVMGPDGKTPHSWRVAILPYLEQQALYKQYKFDEPWDSEANKKVLAQMPAVFRHPGDARPDPFSSYFVLTGPATMFDGAKGAEFADIRDGMSNTILTVEAVRDIPWTKPEDIAFDPNQPLPAIGGFNPDGTNVGFADGSVRFMSKLVDSAMLKSLITKAGREPIVDNSLNAPAVKQVPQQ